MYLSTLHVSYGWLAYVLFHAYHLDACEQKSLGKHAYLSSWRLRYGLNDMIFALYCLSASEIYLKICKTFAKLLFDMPRSYQSHMMILLENHIHICCLFLHWALSNCCDPWEKLALYHPLIPQNKCSTICVGLSLSPVFVKKKRDMVYQKKWTHEGPSIEKKKKMWAHLPWKKKKKKKKIAMLSKEFI